MPILAPARPGMDSATCIERWLCSDPLPPAPYREVVREMNLRGSKWDTQVGDTATLAPFALVLPRTEWQRLARLAESLSAELRTLEQNLAARPDLWPRLGLPRAVLAALNRTEPWTPAAARVVRYDFHPTAGGWQISEVNSDVPGGFNEASAFTKLMAGHVPGCEPAGDPLAALSAALDRSLDGARRYALLAAPGFNEDWQILAGLAASLQRHDIEACPARPEQLVWEQGRAFIRQGAHLLPIGSIYRFYQGEWLARLAGEKWQPLLRGGLTPVCNPAAAILTESKRLPLLWPALQAEMRTWRQLLPETQDPRSILRTGLAKRVLKPAYCNTGDTVAGTGWQSRRSVLFSALRAVTQPGAWIAQKRFTTLPLMTPLGSMYPCLGIYTINGTATGIYARLSAKPVVDYSARDVAILLRE